MAIFLYSNRASVTDPQRLNNISFNKKNVVTASCRLQSGRLPSSNGRSFSFINNIKDALESYRHIKDIRYAIYYQMRQAVVQCTTAYRNSLEDCPLSGQYPTSLLQVSNRRTNPSA